MIVLYILLGIIIFILLMFALMIFVPLNIYIKGTYWDKKPTGLMEVYWLKYFLGARLRIKDMDHLHILIWFIGIPLPMKFSLKQDEEKSPDEKKSKDETEEKSDDPVKVGENETEEKESISDKIRNIVNAKDRAKDLWSIYKAYLKKIFVSYVTFSLEYIDAEIGLKDPDQTGLTAGIVYSALSIKPLDNIKVSWDYAKPNFNISTGLKMTMNLYGILRTLLSLYLRYKKDRKNELQ